MARIFLGILLFCCLCPPMSLGQETTVTSPVDFRPDGVLVLRLEDESVNPVTARFIVAAIDRAEKENAMLVLMLDTPGGLVQSTREIVKRFLSSKVPVVTYVAPGGARAASAGMFITIASHVAAMAPGTNIGAAHVVDITGSWPGGGGGDDQTTGPNRPTNPFAKPPASSGSIMEEKVINDISAWARGIAQLRGRNVEWAEKAVRESNSISAEEAVKLNVVDFIANDLDDLMKQLDGREVNLAGHPTILRTSDLPRTEIQMSQRQRILNMLASPNVALMLLFIAFAGLAYEVTHPGLLAPGTIGLISLLLAALALNMLPTNWAAVLLIIAGIALIIAEIKFVSYGLLTVAGAVCLFFGAIALFDQPFPFMGVPVMTALGMVIGVTSIMALLVFLILRTHRLPPAIGVSSLVGGLAEVKRELCPEGKVFMNGTHWDAVASETIPVGTHVRVVQVREGMVLVVEKTKLEPATIAGPADAAPTSR